jgi:hypothetical protein
MRTAAAAVRFPVRVWSRYSRPTLHSELQVLHLPVMPLQDVLHGQELLVRRREVLRHLQDGDRRPRTRHHVLTLRVQQELPEKDAFPR